MSGAAYIESKVVFAGKGFGRLEVARDGAVEDSDVEIDIVDTTTPGGGSTVLSCTRAELRDFANSLVMFLDRVENDIPPSDPSTE